jgi:glycyl-tRNA synthetase beta chain
MRWGASRSEFIRPVHWLVILFGADIIPAEILGVTSNNLSRGHRFHCDTWLPIANPANYEKLLAESGHVIADFNKRQQIILQQVTEQGEKLGGETVVSEDLLEEVTGLVEWPVALAGSFDDDFLAVPPEALISSMKEHQKYFHLVDNTGKLLPNFITVANISSEDPAQVIQGNERVIRPRLSDAAFFYETDKKVRLDSRIEKLNSIVFQAKLGTLYEKTQRVKKLAGFIAGLIGGNVDYAERAAELSKADLISDMVLEFDKMQGVAGCYYALNDGEAIEVAHALKDQYLPKFSGDALPESLTACALALADRLDTLVGLFGIGQPPTGSKDPFALRRASLSILRIIIEKDFDLEILALIEAAASQYDNLPQASTVVDVVHEYIKDRFENMVVEQGVSVESFRATINTPGHSFNAPLSAHQRAHIVQIFSQTEAAKDLAEAAKRTRNILAKNPSEQDSIDASAFIHSAEKELAAAIEKAQQEIASPDINLQLKLEALAKLQQPVSTFFDEVMVVADNETTRNNRLALLKALNSLFLSVLDISYLALSR